MFLGLKLVLGGFGTKILVLLGGVVPISSHEALFSVGSLPTPDKFRLES